MGERVERGKKVYEHGITRDVAGILPCCFNSFSPKFLRSNSRTITVLDTGEQNEILTHFYSKPNFEIQFLNLTQKKEIEIKMLEFISLINNPILDFALFEQKVDSILL